MPTSDPITIDRPFARLHVRGRRCVPVGKQPSRVAAPLGAVPVAIYCRTSGRNQRIDSQYAECRKYCDRHGYAVVREYFEEWHSGDAPYVGPTLHGRGNVFDRPLFRELLLETMLYRPFDTIICWSDDRWSRLPGREAERILNALRRLDVQLEYVVPDHATGLLLDLVEVADAEEGDGRRAERAAQ